MSRGDQIYNYPLWSIKRLPKLLKYGRQMACELSKRYGGFWFAYLLDMLWCDIHYGAMDSRDYLLFRFYEKNGRSKSTFFTKRMYFKLIRKFDRDLFVALCDKSVMYDKYKLFIKRDWMIVDETVPMYRVEEFIALHGGECMCKPVSSEQGHGVGRIKQTGINDLYARLHGGCRYIVEGVLGNDPELQRINPSSLNTLRIYTIVTDTDEVKIIAAFLRCGVGTVDVDNWGAGGIGYPIDLESGIISGRGVDKKGEFHIVHPNGVVVLGMKIPRFKDACKMCCDCINLDKRVVFAGIDVAVTSNGVELVELNFPGGYTLLQAIDLIGRKVDMDKVKRAVKYDAKHY